MPVRTRFNPQPNGMPFFSDTERDEAYLRASPFFLEQMRILLENGWKRNDCNSDEFLFDISKRKKGRRIFLPKTFVHFLDISNFDTWRKVFENPWLFEARYRGKNETLDLFLGPQPPLFSIFYLLQILAPGMLVIYHEYQFHDEDVKASRLLPPASWIQGNTKYLQGNSEYMSKMDTLLAAANDRKLAFYEERTTRPQITSHLSSLPGTDALPAAFDKKEEKRSQNNSHHSLLPGTDAFPAAAKDQKIASDEKGKRRSQNDPLHSSLPGTDALPAAAKVQKTTSHKKKKKRQPQSNSSSYIAPRYHGNYITTSSSGYGTGSMSEYGMCDKDCGWCGQCSNGFDFSDYL